MKSAPDRYSVSTIGHQVPTEVDRLRELSAYQDADTFDSLRAIGIQPNWACLDVGAGNGSVAEWLAARVPGGSVLATDIDIRHLRADVPRMTAMVHDVATDDFAPASFDLVHVRMVLMHLARPQDVVRKIVRWLRPGGYLVIGGFDVSIGTRSPEPTLARVMTALERHFREEIGSDLRAERLAPQWLRNAGMVDVHAGYHPAVCGVGQAGQGFLLASLEQIRSAVVSSGYATDRDFLDVRAWLDEPGAAEIYGVRPIVWAKRPR